MATLAALLILLSACGPAPEPPARELSLYGRRLAQAPGRGGLEEVRLLSAGPAQFPAPHNRDFLTLCFQAAPHADVLLRGLKGEAARLPVSGRACLLVSVSGPAYPRAVALLEPRMETADGLAALSKGFSGRRRSLPSGHWPVAAQTTGERVVDVPQHKLSARVLTELFFVSTADGPAGLLVHYAATDGPDVSAALAPGLARAGPKKD